MKQDKYIFAQITEFLPRRVFDRIVSKHQGNKYVRYFTCWNQMLCMVFGQLTARDSMRDLMLSLEAHQTKYYHLGLGIAISRRNLGKANENRNSEIIQEFDYVLIDEARKSCYQGDFEVKVDGNVYALDSTTIDLCLSVFWWAEFRKTKGGIKMHTLFDVVTSIPSFLYISEASLHDVNVLDILHFEAVASTSWTRRTLTFFGFLGCINRGHSLLREPRIIYALSACTPDPLTEGQD